MKPTIVFCLLLTLFAGYFWYKTNTKKNTQNLLSINAQKTILYSTKPSEIVILWDLHQVVFERSFLHWIYLFIRNIRPFSILANLDYNTSYLMTKFILRKLHLHTEEITSQEVIFAAKKAQNYALIDLIMKISCDYQPTPEVVLLIKKLQEKGYTQDIGSNIGESVFEEFSKKYPDVFTLFNEDFIIHVEQGKHTLKKPNPDFFINYITQKNIKPSQVIFIDDRAKNIASAQQCGIIGIQYKNPEQLASDLKTIGIL